MTAQNLELLVEKINRAASVAAKLCFRKYRGVLPADQIDDLMMFAVNLIWRHFSRDEIIAARDEDLVSFAFSRIANIFRREIRRRKVTSDSLEDKRARAPEWEPAHNPSSAQYSPFVEYEPYCLAQNPMYLNQIIEADAQVVLSCLKDDPRRAAYIARAQANRERLEALRKLETAGNTSASAVCAKLPEDYDLPTLIECARSQMDELALRAIDALPEPHKTLFGLHWLHDDGIANREAAKLLGISQPTAWRYLAVASKACKSLLQVMTLEQDLKRRIGPHVKIGLATPNMKTGRSGMQFTFTFRRNVKTIEAEALPPDRSGVYRMRRRRFTTDLMRTGTTWEATPVALAA